MTNPAPATGRLLVAAILTAIAACSAPVSSDRETGNNMPEPSSLALLADRYLNEVHETEAENAALLNEVLALPPDASRVFFAQVRETQLKSMPTEMDDETQFAIALDDAIESAAFERGVNRLLLAPDDIDEAFKRTRETALIPSAVDNELGVSAAAIGACPGAKVPCASLPFPSIARTGNCGPGCIGGSNYDRVSNSACEDGACDHRIHYRSATLRTGVASSTGAAACVLRYYNNAIISRWEGGYTQLGFGILGPASCLILANVSSYLMNSTRVF